MNLKILFTVSGLLLGMKAMAQEPKPTTDPSTQEQKFNWARIEEKIDAIAEASMKNHPEFSTISIYAPEEENQASNELNAYLGVSFKNSLWSKHLTSLTLHANFKATRQNTVRATLKLEGLTHVIKAIQFAASEALRDRSTVEVEGAKELLEEISKANTIEEIFTPAAALLELLKKKEPNDELAQKARLRINRTKTKMTLSYDGDYPVYREGGINLAKLEVSAARGKFSAEVVIVTPNGVPGGVDSLGEMRTTLLGSLEAGEGEMADQVAQTFEYIVREMGDRLIQKSK